MLMRLLPLAAQTTTGSIVGTVTDPSGAVLATTAGVTVTNMDTGIAIKTNTRAHGPAR